MLILISIYFKALSFVLTFLLIDDVLVSVSEKDIPESLIERLAEERYVFFLLLSLKKKHLSIAIKKCLSVVMKKDLSVAMKNHLSIAIKNAYQFP